MKFFSAIVAISFVLGSSAFAQQQQPAKAAPAKPGQAVVSPAAQPATQTAQAAPGAQPARKKAPMIKKVDDNMSGQGYGMAGCGLGSIVFGDQPGFMQLFAGTTNGFSSSQTFGISTGTSNCGEASKSAQATQFIEVNKVAIETEISRGEGETLSALSQVLDCKNSAFNSDLKSNYSKSFPDGGASVAQIEATAHQVCQ